MSPNPKQTRKAIDTGIATTLATATQTGANAAAAGVTTGEPVDAMTRALETYRGIRPLLTFAANLPILPRRWREALNLFIQQLDTLTLTEPQIVARFKAGRDL